MTKHIVFIGPFGLRPKATMSIRAVPLAKGLTTQGYTLTVLIPPWDDAERAGQSWTEDGVRIINVPLPRKIFRVPLLFHILLTRILVAQALTLQPDVIHFFKPKAYAGLAHLVVWWIRKLSGLNVRLVVDTDDWEQAWNEVSPYSALQKKVFAWQEQWGLRHADTITVASRALEKLVGQTGRASSDIFYLPNGHHAQSTTIEPGQGSQDETPDLPTPNAPTILLYSRFLEFRLKRIVTLIEMVARQLPNARWLIVGEGLHGEEKILAQELNQAKLSEYVHFTGWLPIAQVPACFTAANVAIYPYDDTLINRTKCSVKLISLLAAGLPVIADAVGQNCEYIESGVSGILTQAEDDAAFSEAIITLLQDPGRQQQLGQNAAQRIQEEFNWTTLAHTARKAYS